MRKGKNIIQRNERNKSKTFGVGNQKINSRNCIKAILLFCRKPKTCTTVKWKTLYHIYGIGCPFILFTLVAIINHTRPSFLQSIHPGIAQGRCWFKCMSKIYWLYLILFEIWNFSITWGFDLSLHSNGNTYCCKYRPFRLD